MSEPELYADVEGAVRTWLRSRPAIIALVGPRVFFTADNPTEASYPMIELFRVGGAIDRSEVPLDNAVLQFNCWGPMRRKDTASEVARALVSELTAIVAELEVAPGIVLFPPTVDVAGIWLPDPTTQRPRYVVSATVPSLVV